MDSEADEVESIYIAQSGIVNSESTPGVHLGVKKLSGAA